MFVDGIQFLRNVLRGIGPPPLSREFFYGAQALNGYAIIQRRRTGRLLVELALELVGAHFIADKITVVP